MPFPFRTYNWGPLWRDLRRAVPEGVEFRTGAAVARVEATAGGARVHTAAGGALVGLGRSLGRALVQETPEWGELDQAGLEAWWAQADGTGVFGGKQLDSGTGPHPR
jgi:hypothetical protein